MKAVKWIAGIFGTYVVFVILFESVFLGYFQPKFDGALPMVQLVTTDESGEEQRRMLAGFEVDGIMYLSAHHWPRGWFKRAMQYPAVRAVIDDEEASYTAVQVGGDEFDLVAETYPMPLPVLFLMGFPPERDILRLDPVVEAM